MEKNQNTLLHIVVVTAYIMKNGKVLILRRSPRERVFPGKWAGVGGKIERSDYEHLPRNAVFPQWHGVVEHVLRKEVREETGLEIGKPQMLSERGDLVFEREVDGERVLVLIHMALYESGEVRLNHEHDDYAWVTAKDAGKYDLIDGALDEIRQVFKEMKNPR